MDSYQHTEGELLPLSWRRSDQCDPVGATSWKKVDQIAALMRAGVPFPPIGIVVGRDGRFFIQDGAHRVAAAMLCGYT
jgi:hypothetical protein